MQVCSQSCFSRAHTLRNARSSPEEEDEEEEDEEEEEDDDDGEEELVTAPGASASHNL